jgi:hypothetical protein
MIGSLAHWVLIAGVIAVAILFYLVGKNAGRSEGKE